MARKYKKRKAHITNHVPEGMIQIPGYSRYYINLEGCVWSQCSGKYLQPVPDRGYVVFNLTADNSTSTVMCLGKLLLMAFIRPPREGEVCRHLNDIKSDVRLKNLAWGTYSQNKQDAVNNGTFRIPFGDRHWNTKLNNLDVINIHMLCKQNYQQKEVAKMYKIDQTTVHNILHGITWRHIKEVVEQGA